MKNMIHAADALRAAAAEARLAPEALSLTKLTLSGGLYEIEFDCEWMHYDCSVDAATAEVLGFLSEPLPFEAALEKAA